MICIRTDTWKGKSQKKKTKSDDYNEAILKQRCMEGGKCKEKPGSN